MHIVQYVALTTGVKAQANLLTPVLYIITAITILWLMNYDRLKGVYSSGLLFMFWLLVSLAIIPDFYQQLNHTKSVLFWIKLISFGLHFFCAFGLFITTCFAEKYIASELIHDERV